MTKNLDDRQARKDVVPRWFLHLEEIINLTCTKLECFKRSWNYCTRSEQIILLEVKLIDAVQSIEHRRERADDICGRKFGSSLRLSRPLPGATLRIDIGTNEVVAIELRGLRRQDRYSRLVLRSACWLTSIYCRGQKLDLLFKFGDLTEETGKPM